MFQSDSENVVTSRKNNYHVGLSYSNQSSPVLKISILELNIPNRGQPLPLPNKPDFGISIGMN
jgi:hypothetical protein